MRNMYWWLFIW